MRILSGLKPTGRPHLGNYLGAIRQWIALQEQGEGFYFLADLHGLDQMRDAATMRAHTIEAALDYLALGIDPERSALFVQSHVPEVPACMWLLGSVTPLGLLHRAHAFKDAQAKGKDSDFGLFAYPILMAADILLYDSDLVPVGQDQKQHVEIARDIAVKFNQTYAPGFDAQSGAGGVLKLPESLVLAEVATVPGTDGRKMSKSYDNGITLFGTDKETKKAIMSIVTDSLSVEAPKDPDTCNIFAILRLLASKEETAEIAARYRAGGTGYGAFKTRLLELFHERFDPARERRVELAKNLDHVHGVLAAGARRARAVAAEVLARLEDAVGLLPPHGARTWGM